MIDRELTYVSYNDFLSKLIRIWPSWYLSMACALILIYQFRRHRLNCGGAYMGLGLASHWSRVFY